ncbi:MAG: M56 family metallopeptidase [Oscillospiraceae bacterium]|nr:M56 family metallopeptidase [Oscillospiraceae bacterium]
MSAGALGALGQASLSAATMILAAAVLRLRFQERVPRRVFCLLWDLCLLRLLIPVRIACPVSIRALLDRGQTLVQAEAVQEVWYTGFTPGPGAAPAEVFTGALAEEAVSGSAGGLHLPVSLLPLVWGLGLALWAAWFLWGHLRSRRVYAMSLPLDNGFVRSWQREHPLFRPVQVRFSDRIAAPLTYGVIYPVVLLPRGMDLADTAGLACVLEHEYTHIRRFDALRKWLLAAALCLHWFNPCVWLLYVLAGRDMELSCDEAVVRAGADPGGYALTLLDLEEERGRWSPHGSHFSRNATEERIRAIMKRKQISLAALLAVLVVMSIATTVFATNAPETDSSTRQGAGAVSTGMIMDSVISKRDENGNTLYSADEGKSWMSEDRYRAEYGDWGENWQVEWWTAEEYEDWLEQEKKDLQEIIGERGYTASTGWFTWDQKRVDETIALYEEILENIKKGALYSKRVLDRDGNEMGDISLGMDGFVSTCDEQAQDALSVSTVFTSPADLSGRWEEARVNVSELLKACEPYGLTGSEQDGLFYNGQRVRCFVDGYSLGEPGLYGIGYTYIDDGGTVDVHTLRGIIFNPDGSYNPYGELTALAAAGEAGFDQDIIDCAQPSAGPQVAVAAGNAGAAGGRTFEEIFAQYKDYGLTYEPTAGGRGNLFYNGQPVASFADQRPDGGVFSFMSDSGEGLTLRTEYGGDGVLLGLKTA